MILSIAFNLGILFYNKYLNFATYLLHRFLIPSLEITEIALPIGISFFTFQAMSYVIDVYRGSTPVQKNPYYLGLYISFFPQLVAGPIVRYTTVAEQIENRSITLRKFCNGVSQFMAGFSMKILLSNTFSVIADEAFNLCGSSVLDLSAGFAWIGAIAYSLQILFDFSGYSAMAIGLGKMFGFDFPPNFNYPYIAKTVTDFWRRWHISLSQFFRDYVYIPLGGSRVSSVWKLIRNLFVVWLLTGIWHGANFTFILWGLGYFVLLCFEKLTGLAKRQLPKPAEILYRVFTMVCVVMGWVMFRSETWRGGFQYIKAMFGLYGNALWDSNALRNLNDYKTILLIGILCCTPIFPKLKEFAQTKFRAGEAVSFVYDMALVGCVLLGISCLVMGANNPFIYFNF